MNYMIKEVFLFLKLELILLIKSSYNEVAGFQ